jgi:Ca2+-binding RTX toxin-like protein
VLFVRANFYHHKGQLMRGSSRNFRNAGQFQNRKRRARCLRQRSRASAIGFESLERRALLTADIAVANFSADGTNLLVDYDVNGANVSAFNISIYRSSNGTSLDTLLQTQRMTASGDLQVGSGHRATFAPSFDDTDSDYFLVAVVDSSGEVSESSESNNQATFGGGVFLASDGLLHVHGRSTGDYVIVSESATFAVTFNSSVYSHAISAVNGVRIRSHNGSDVIVASGTSRPQLICGGDGGDTILGGSGSDLIRGGAGNDYVYGNGSADDLYGDDGSDLLDGGAGSDQITGGAANDSLYGGTGDDLYWYAYDTNHGHDTISELSGGGTDLINFQYLNLNDDDSIGGITLDLGDDGGQQNVASVTIGGVMTSRVQLTLAYVGQVESACGTAYNDTIYAASTTYEIYGLGGDDTIYGCVANSTLMGGDGADSLIGGSGNEVLNGGAGTDTISGGNGNDTLYGEAGDDTLNGGAGDDTYRFWGNYDLGTDTIAETASNGTDTLDFTGVVESSLQIELMNTGNRRFWRNLLSQIDPKQCQCS